MEPPTIIEGYREDIRAALERPEMEGRPMKLIVLPDEPAAETLLQEAVSRMTRRSPEEIARAQRHAMQAYPPARPVPPGRTLADVIAGRWPGDETDAQVQAALEELS